MDEETPGCMTHLDKLSLSWGKNSRDEIAGMLPRPSPEPKMTSRRGPR